MEAIDLLTKHHDGASYVFTVGTRGMATTATFTEPDDNTVDVLGEHRSLLGHCRWIQ